jgi:hypothetical protein
LSTYVPIIHDNKFIIFRFGATVSVSAFPVTESLRFRFFFVRAKDVQKEIIKSYHIPQVYMQVQLPVGVYQHEEEVTVPIPLIWGQHAETIAISADGTWEDTQFHLVEPRALMSDVMYSCDVSEATLSKCSVDVQKIPKVYRPFNKHQKSTDLRGPHNCSHTVSP